MRLTLVISSLTSGGAERNMVILANYWAEKGWPIHLITLDDAREPPFYPLHPAVKREGLDLTRPAKSPADAVRNNLQRVSRMRRAIRASRPDAVISFMSVTNVTVLLATAGLGLKVIVSERINPASEPLSRPWELLRTLTYPLATNVVVQVGAILEFFPPSIRRIGRVIPNPVLPPPGGPGGAAALQPEAPERIVMAMGRLVEQKGFDLLLRAFAQLADRYPAWKLVIWGDGPMREELEHLRDALGLQGRAELPGRTRNSYGELRRASLFVLSSRFEGFPNVVCEALACGVPVVSFDCPTGPADIIRPGIDGLLAPLEDLPSLTRAMERLMSDDAERRRFSERAPEVVERFRLDRIMQMWEALIES